MLMTFDELLGQVSALLQREGRVSYRALKRRFELQDDDIEDLKAELIDAKRLALDEDNKVLVWADTDTVAVTTHAVPVSAPAPASYTPAHLAERIRAEQAAMDIRSTMDGQAEGERKTITALFADLKGSTALIERLDPEEARKLIDPALHIMMEAVHAYEGYVAQALGDGIFALFGAPIAHEDHAQRAVHAAIAMQTGMRAYSERLRRAGGRPLDMRVGINSGDVVVRSIRKDDLHTDYVPVGHSTNLAARVEQMASPGTVLITEYTQNLVAGYFKLKSLGPATIKGVEQPLTLFEVVGLGRSRTRFQVSTTRGLTRFVGRQNELEQLRQALLQTEHGHGQVVGIMGEPGLGKSRLLHEFKALVPGQSRVLEAFGVSYGKGSPYLPMMELLKRFFDFAPDDDERRRRSKIIGQVLALDKRLDDTLPYLFALLGIGAETANLQHMDPQIRRRRTFDALKRLIVQESMHRPLLLMVEDLHWIDSETQGFLDTLVEGMAAERVLLVTNYRPEYRHEWGTRTYYSQIRLVPLLHAEGAQLLENLVGTDTQLASLKRQILERTEGTPFYIEEVVQSLLEKGILSGERGFYGVQGQEAALQIPRTVQGVLAARIDRLPRDEKELLLQLAVIGREFSSTLVRRVVNRADDELDQTLIALQRSEFLYQHAVAGDAGFMFKHALTQEVAYGAVLQDQKKALHEKVARAMELLFQSNLDEHYPALAHHYHRSGNLEKAIEYHYLAGAQAAERSANHEAVQLFETALDMAVRLPDSYDRDQQELKIQLASAAPLLALQGLASPRAEIAYARVSELCRKTGKTEALFSAALGLHIVYLQQAKLAATHEVASQLLLAAQHRQDPTQLMQAHLAAGISAFFSGELRGAHEHCEQAVVLYDVKIHEPQDYYVWVDHRVGINGFSAKALRLLGEVDQASVRSAAALALARKLAHPPSIAFALYAEMVVRESRREWSVVQDLALQEVALSSEQGFPLWHAWGTIFMGRARAELGDCATAITEIQAAIDEFEAINSQLLRPYCLAFLAEAYGRAHRYEQGLVLLDDALDRIETTGEGFYVAELHRLKGELLLRSNSTVDRTYGEQQAESYFLQALDIARQQGAKLLELRAATSLARLWVSQSRFEEAVGVLADVYAWFTEGFEIADLRDARTLLDELTPRAAKALA